MNTICEGKKCNGCMACVDICNKKAVTVKDKVQFYIAEIDASKCVNCGLCRKVCPNESIVESKLPIEWYQGWANDKNIREKASSGGFATAISKSFIENGGIVCSCEYANGEFSFTITDKVEKLEKYKGSKYVKSNPHGIYGEIKKKLVENKKVLMIALPCQIAAAKNFIGDRLQENFYTVDLICHGTPSPKHLTEFLKQYNISMQEINNISFRRKNSFRVKENGRAIVYPGTLDRYTLAFLNAFNYTENCYSCQFAQRKRISDLTIGDSWGSSIKEEERRRGISLALCMTSKGKELLTEADLYLQEVDLENAIDHNHQLEYPSKKPLKYDTFMKHFLEGYTYNKNVFSVLPRPCINQKIKEFLYRVSGGGAKVIMKSLLKLSK